jgi:CRISPR-associated protein Csb1
MLDEPGVTPKTYTIDSKRAIALLNEAIDAAKAAGLTWMEQKLVLKPAPELVDLVRKSQEVAAAEVESEAS